MKRLLAGATLIKVKNQKRRLAKSDGTVVMKMEHTKEEVINQTIKQCKDLIMEYKKYEDNYLGLSDATRPKEYAELF